MKKKNYSKPTMMVVPFKFKAPLLVGSGKSGDRSAGMEDYNVNNYYEE